MKTIKTRKFYLLILLLPAYLSLQAQRFDTALSKLNANYMQEKLHLHFDRASYNPGETIWFKAYLFAGIYPSLISKTLYVELLDDKGKMIERKTAPVVISSTASSFDVPENFSGSAVYIRAYTKWMLNFDSSFIYSKAIPIINSNPTAKSIQLSQKNNAAVITQQPIFFLQFFPEGGDLVQQIKSRVAFKATNNTGLPVNISGDILDSRKNKITSFSSVHDGMGSFELLPQPGEVYKAVWKDETKKIHETLLPVAKQNGVVLEVNNNLNQIEFKVKSSVDNPPGYPFVYVVAQMDQQLLYKAKANITKKMIASGIIPSENLPAGIIQVTLFTPDEKPIAERITFINLPAYSFITDLNAVLKDLGKRKKNVIQIDVPDTILTNLSVSVTDAELDPFQTEDNIFSHLLLTDDIKGYVHNPAYYFSSDADSVADHLDLVMMTNGWRRFKWENILAGNFPKLNYTPENYLSIEGRMYGVNKALMANKEMISIIQLKNGNKQFLNTAMQPDGKFTFPDMIFYDTAKFYYQVNNDKNKSLTTRADFDIKTSFLKEALRQKPDSNLSLRLAPPDTIVLTKNKEIYKEQLSRAELSKVKTLKEVVVTTNKKSKEQILDEQYTSGFFSGGQGHTFSPEDDPAFSAALNVLQYLQGRVAGLQISMGSPVTATRRGSTTSFFLNEMPVDADMVQNTPMSDVAMVKVFDPPFFGASGGGAGGAIAVYLKKGANTSDAKGLDFINIAGYSPAKEFYSPDYSKPNQSTDNDYRKTLYWNPFVITNKEHRRIFLPFYNNDITKKIKIIIEGCNEDGKLTRAEKVLQ